MDTKEAKARFYHLVHLIWNGGDLLALSAMCRGDVEVHWEDGSQSVGVPAFQAGIDGFRAQFPDLRVDVQELVLLEDSVVMRSVRVGTSAGVRTPMGMLPAGLRVKVPGLSYFAMIRDRVTEAWINEDSLGLYRTMGLAPVPIWMSSIPARTLTPSEAVYIA